MNWSEINEPTDKFKSSYDYIFCKTPLGIIIIEWKSWKENPGFSIELDGRIWIGTEYDLDAAKNKAKEYFEIKLKELQDFLND